MNIQQQKLSIGQRTHKKINRLLYCVKKWANMHFAGSLVDPGLRQQQFHRNENMLQQPLRAQHVQLSKIEALKDNLALFEFAASHDLAEHLRSIVSFSQLLSRKIPLSSPDSAHLLEIQASGKKMHQTLNDLLLYVQLDGLIAPFTQVHLKTVIGPIIREVGSTGIVPEQIQLGALPTISGNVKMLRLLFLRLLDNAYKYQRADSPLQLGIGQVETDSSKTIIYFKDNGIGIEDAYLHKVFQPFFRTHDRSVSGSGLGLAICQKIMTLHKGRIWASKNAQAGTTIFIEFNS